MIGFSVLALFCVLGAIHAKEKVVACYYGTWAVYRPGVGNFAVEDVDPFLCTHIFYAFAGIDAEGTVISLDPYLELPENNDNFRKFNGLKKKNSSLKTLLAVGGWSQGSSKYSVMAANPALRRNFIESGLQMILDYNFDGLSIDWLYPNSRDTVHGRDDIDNFTQLLKELREEFDKYGLILTAAVASHEEAASLSYDVPSVAKYVDYLNLMTYDLAESFDRTTVHNAPLYKGEGYEVSDIVSTLYTVDVAVEYWLKSGCPPEKLVLGVPFYGPTFVLNSADENGVGAPVTGPGISGPFTLTRGVIGYNEFCSKLRTESWTIRRDNLAKVPYAFSGTNWVSYDDPESIREKVEYANSLNLGGIKVWSIETDDFRGTCGGGKFPLLTAVNKALCRNIDASTTNPTCRRNQGEL